MYKNRKAGFVLTCTAYLCVCLLDLYLTYRATPNLYLEGNPLIDSLGWGWGGLIAINAVTYIGYLAMSWYAFLRYKPRESNESDMKRYLADITYGDPDKIVPMMYKLPKHWSPQIACMCWAVSIALPFSRLIICFEWLLLVLRVRAPMFFSIVALFPGGRIDFVFAILFAWILSFVWMRLDYKAHLKRLEERNNAKAEQPDGLA